MNAAYKTHITKQHYNELIMNMDDFKSYQLITIIISVKFKKNNIQIKSFNSS